MIWLNVVPIKIWDFYIISLTLFLTSLGLYKPSQKVNIHYSTNVTNVRHGFLEKRKTQINIPKLPLLPIFQGSSEQARQIKQESGTLMNFLGTGEHTLCLEQLHGCLFQPLYTVHL
jgi:hypothetical protein